MMIDCCRTGYCCGNGRDSALGDWYYDIGEPTPKGVGLIEQDGKYLTPVDENGSCAFMVVHDNGFTSCRVHEQKPKMCALYNCLTEKKVVYVSAILEKLKGKCE